VGYNFFMSKFNLLSEGKQIEILEKIFGLNNVSFFDTYVRDRRIVFRIYNGKYYQFKFSFDEVLDKKFYEVVVDRRIVSCEIYVKNFVDKGDYFSKFIKILLGEFNYLCYFL